MCIVNVQFCPSCQVYSPIVALHPPERPCNYLQVYDKMCQEFYCLKASIVDSPWIPTMDPNLVETCQVCQPINCFVNVFYRDCKTMFVDNKMDRFVIRKAVYDKWTRHYKLWDIC